MNQKDYDNIDYIKTFLNENNIVYNSPELGVFDIVDRQIQIRYVNSADLKIGYKRFGYTGTTMNYCYNISREYEDRGIRIMWWRDFEMANQRKNNLIKSYLLSACGKVKNRVYARDCEIKQIPSHELREFLDNNCFYGYRSASLNLGLYLKKDVGDLKKGTLVMMWSVGHAFFGKKLYDMEIIRAATLLYTQVIGGSSKLFNRIKETPIIRCGNKDIEWNSLSFYVDYDHNNGASLPKIGFKFLNYSGGGFMNLNVETGEAFNRKPNIHKEVMKWMAEGRVISTPLAGVKTFVYCKNGDYSQFKLDG